LNHDIFDGRSPLDVAKVQGILTLIQQGSPRVIGVDLDTSPSEYGKGNFPKAVWVRDALPDCEQDADLEGTGKDRLSTIWNDVRGYLTWPWTRSRATAPHAKGLRRLSFLGGGFKETEESGRVKTVPTSGLSVFPLDRDGVVRRYCATYFSDQADPPSCKGGLVDSFPKAVYDAYCTAGGKTVRSESRMMLLLDSLLRWLSGKTVRKRSESCKPTHGDEGLILNFSGDRYDFPHMSVRQLKQAAERPFWSTSSPLRGRIVLLGGAYRAARDLYFTPVGPRHGVEIAAQAIQSELPPPGGVRPLNRAIALLIHFASGIALIWLNQKFHGRYMLLVNALFIAVASLFGSLLAFYAFVYWFNFTAVLVGVWIHVLWEREAHARKMKDELKSTEKELREVRQERDRSQAEVVTVKAERDEYRTKYEALLP
jgi:hypothetical protein